MYKDIDGLVNYSVEFIYSMFCLTCPGLPEDSKAAPDGVINKHTRYLQEVLERAVRLVIEHQGECMNHIGLQ